MIKNENFLNIQGWMITKLKLKGNELLLYALIFGFCQTEEQEFTGSHRYLEAWLGISRQTVINTLKSLIDKNLIKKREEYINNVKFCRYSINFGVFNNFDRRSKNFIGDVKNFDRGSQKILHNNINNKENNIKEKEQEEKENKKNVLEFLEQEFGRTLSPLEVTKCIEWLEIYKDESIIKHAIELAVLYNKKTFAYINGILVNWKTCNYKTLDEIIENEKKIESNKVNKTPNWFNDEIKSTSMSKEKQKELQQLIDEFS